MTIVAIAELCHEANAAYCRQLGDNSQPTWAQAPDWQTRSAIKGVEFHLRNICAAPSDSHNQWLDEKKKTGWVFGKVKDPQKKEHPCIVPFHQLPKSQRFKDHLFQAIVHSAQECFGVRPRRV